MDHAPSSIGRDRSLDARAALQTMLWWAAGTSITVGPIMASIFTPNRSPTFWPSLVAVTVAGGVAGLVAHLKPRTRLGQRLVRLPASMLVALGLPISVGVGLAIENAGLGEYQAAMLLYLAVVAAVVAVGWLCRWGPWWRPAVALRRASWLWLTLSVVLLPALGLGLFFVPLAAAYRRAARALDQIAAETYVGQ